MNLQDQLQIAVSAHQNGDLDAAETAYRAVLEQDPQQADALHFSGLLAHQRGRTQEAFDLIKQSLEAFPANAAAYNNLGNIHREIGQKEQALAAYEAALEVDASHANTWNNVGVLLRGADRMEEAANVLRQAVEIAPDHAEAWHNLGMTCLLWGKYEEAADSFEKCISLDYEKWSDPVWHARVLCKLGRVETAIAHLEAHIERRPGDSVATHQLAAIRGEDVARAPDAYVREHFDSFSESFDEVLEKLQYRAPEIVAERVAALAARQGKFADCADLGCGTGLCGPLIAEHVGQLVGVDLSPGMLRRAHNLGVYTFLVEGELVAFLNEAPRDAFDLAVCVDTLCYFGPLEEMMTALRPALAPGGVLVATVERLNDPSGQAPGYLISDSGRYSHSADYLRQAAAAGGLDVENVEDVILRKELGQDVHGHVFTLRRSG